MNAMDSRSSTPRTYRIEQLGPPRDHGGELVSIFGRGEQRNEAVSGFDGLTLHHPGDNRAARMQDGVVVEGKAGRAFGYVGGQLQDIEIQRRDRNGQIRTYGLQPDQVLVKKDFILSHPDHNPMSREGRMVDVPSPVAGVIGARRDGEGLVDILDRPDGEVIARFRHMSSIRVTPGETVAYGQTLGIQGSVATSRTHVHMEMDTRHYQQFRNYVDDLVSGRLPMESEHRLGVQPRAVIDDGTFRLGESGDRIRDLQIIMDREGYRAPGGGPIDRDGVYRIGMQGALLDFQRDHGLPQTGDIDQATLRFAPPDRPRETDRQDHIERWRIPELQPEPHRAPGHPDHPDHRPGLPDTQEPPVNQRVGQASGFDDPQLNRLLAAFNANDEGAVSLALSDIAKSRQMQDFLEKGRDMLAVEEARERQQQAEAQQVGPSALSRG